ncbi:cobalamin biosynthesis protein CbiG [Aquibium oceanicum]|uniref:Cobalamin biosynthesis protein CbiG n=1 Tax=Aquibium oceanicum TaxID=1670800 RepID=A0A1L3SNX9_9HYPH|nr:cobalamin biosynthesis protein CbiG [Aquibium oceanicum]
MMVAGIGCRKGVSSAEILAALDAALSAHGLARTQIDALASLPQKRGEPALADVASLLQRPLILADETALEATKKTILTRSKASLAATGHGSVAEAAALAVAGPAARLLGPRIAAGPATCAIAYAEAQP